MVDALVEQHLRRRVVGRAAAGVGAIAHLLGKAEVAQLDVALGVQEHVLGLEVTIDDFVHVDVGEREHERGDVEARDLLGDLMRRR